MLALSNPLPLLGPHLGVFAGSTVGFTLLQWASATFSPKVFPEQFKSFNARNKRGWDSHVVSMVHAIIVIPLALHSLSSEVLKKDPVFGYDPAVGDLLAFTSGYFLWDTVDSLINSTIGFVVHGAACLAVFLFSFRPFLAGFGPPFLLWELSTPFLNIHWFMDKLGYSERYPTVHLVNALLFMLVFFLARIVYGGFNTIVFFQAMWAEAGNIPLHLQLIYCLGNVALNGLNWLWFSKMLQKMLARLAGKDEAEEKKLPNETTALVNGTANREASPSLSLPADPPSPVKAKSEIAAERINGDL